MKQTCVIAIVVASFTAVTLCAVAPCAAAGDPAKEATAKDEILRPRRTIARVVKVEDPDGEVRLLRSDEAVVVITARRVMNQEFYNDDRIEIVGKVRITIKYYGPRDEIKVVSEFDKLYRVWLDVTENPKSRWDNTVGWFSEFLRPLSSGGEGRNVERPSVLK
jgi:CxxC motif-containing protein